MAPPKSGATLTTRRSSTRTINVRIDRALYYVANLVATASDIKLTELARAAIENDLPLRTKGVDRAIGLLQSAKKPSPPQWSSVPDPEHPADAANEDSPFDADNGPRRQINIPLPGALATTIQLVAVAEGVSLPIFVERALLSYIASLRSGQELRVLDGARGIADIKGLLSVIEGLDVEKLTQAPKDSDTK